MDIMLERMLSLIPKKADGKYVHGAKKTFCESIGAPTNIVSEWEAGKTKSYRNYLYNVASTYNVSVAWLKGETDDSTPENKKPTVLSDDELQALDEELIRRLCELSPEELRQVDAFVQGMIANR